MPGCMYVCQHFNVSVCLSVCSYICPYVCWYICIAIHPSVCPSVHPRGHVCIFQVSMCWSVQFLFICLEGGCKLTNVYRAYLNICPYLIESTSDLLITNIKESWTWSGHLGNRCYTSAIGKLLL